MTDPTEREIADAVARLAITVDRPISNGALLELLTRAVRAGIKIGVRRAISVMYEACKGDER